MISETELQALAGDPDALERAAFPLMRGMVSYAERKARAEPGEFLGYGWEALRRAARAWDPNLGSFRNYLRWKLRERLGAARRDSGDCVDKMRHDSARQETQSKSPETRTYTRVDLEDVDVPEMITAPPDAVLQHKEMATLIKKALQKRRGALSLSAKERQVIQGRLAGQTLAAIGENMGVSRERVRQIEAGAHEKMRKIFEKMGIRNFTILGE